MHMNLNYKVARGKLIWLGITGLGLLLVGLAASLYLGMERGSKMIIDEYSAIPVKVNFSAPSITLFDLSARQVSLNDFPNNVILVNNWATWCPPCKAEMPALQEYYLAHEGDGFVVVAIESGESVDEISDFVNQYSLTFPVWVDEKGSALEAFQNWDLPSSYVIDRTGIVRLSWTGSISLQMLEKFVTPLLLD
jgi:peroxiredoxin